jgi:hypothetical protein
MADLWPIFSRANKYPPIFPETLDRFFADIEKKRSYDTSTPEFADFREWLYALAKYFKEIGLSYHDLWHKNLLRRGSQHVAIDFGYSASAADPPPEIETIAKLRADDAARLLEVTASRIEVLAGLRYYAFPDPLKGIAVSKTTHEALMGRIGGNSSLEAMRPLGKGSFGIVYRIFGDDSKVVKITGDYSEARASVKLVGNHNQTIADIYDVFAIPTGKIETGKYENKFVEGGPDIYGIVQEHLFPPDQEWRAFAGFWFEHTNHKEYLDRSAISKVRTAWESEHDGEPLPGRFDLWITSVSNELEANGIKFYDLHSNNIMKRQNGEHVIIDLGQSVSADIHMDAISASLARKNKR